MVKALKESIGTGLFVFQKHGAQGGCQSQSHKARQTDAHSNRDGKLSVQFARNAAQECHRREHGRQYEHNGDQGAGYFLHGLFGSLNRA